jgi:hypothetical protein
MIGYTSVTGRRQTFSSIKPNQMCWHLSNILFTEKVWSDIPQINIARKELTLFGAESKLTGNRAGPFFIRSTNTKQHLSTKIARDSFPIKVHFSLFANRAKKHRHREGMDASDGGWRRDTHTHTHSQDGLLIEVYIKCRNGMQNMYLKSTNLLGVQNIKMPCCLSQWDTPGNPDNDYHKGPFLKSKFLRTFILQDVFTRIKYSGHFIRGHSCLYSFDKQLNSHYRTFSSN